MPHITRGYYIMCMRIFCNVSLVTFSSNIHLNLSLVFKIINLLYLIVLII